MFVTDGPALLKPGERQVRIGAIEALADQTDMIANSKSQIRYQNFEPILDKLHKAGLFPDDQLLSVFAFTARDRML